MSKIAIVTAAWAPNIWSGIGRLSNSLGHKLSELGHDVQIVTYTGKTHSKMVKDKNVTIRYISLDSEVEQPSTLRTDKILKWQEKIFDTLTYQLHNVDLIILVDSYGWNAVKTLDKKVIGLVNFLYNSYGWLKEMQDKELQSKILKEEEDFCRNVDVLLVNNMVMGSKIEMLTGRQAHRYQIGITPSDRFVNAAPTRKGEVIFVGKLNRDKGLERVLRVMVDHPWMTLKVIGSSGDATYQVNLADLCTKLKIERRVKFLGWMNSWEVWNNYISSEIAVIPSIMEPFGYSILDPMSVGVPVIGSTANSLPEIVTDGDDGLLFHNIDELSYALEQLHFMEPLRQLFSVAAREKIHKQFTEDRMVRDIVGYFD